VLGLVGGATTGLAVVAGVAAAAYAAPSLVGWLPARFGVAPHLHGVGRRGHVAITFDDGPDPASTPAVLAALDQLGWSATFFCLGEMTAAAPSLAAEVVAAGHEVGVHGYVHEGAIRRRPAALADDVCRARDVIAHAAGVVPQWYRPPFGELSLGSWVAASQAGLQLILWSAWGRDWRAEATAESVVGDLRKGVLDGGTILLHDSDCTSSPGSWRNTIAALPLLAEHLDGLGLTVGRLCDHGLAA